MAVNPGEEIVNVWLQDICGYFTKQNINVPKGKKGGRGKEIDILGINAKDEKRIWVEVTVSPSPRLPKSSEVVKIALETVKNKFCEEKENRVKSIFGNKKFSKMFVYSKRILPNKYEDSFLKEIPTDIEPKHFETIFKDTVDRMNYYSVDPTRIYLFYVNRFRNDIFPKKN